MCVRLASALVLLAARAAAATDYGLRGLATTWETDDDNSILVRREGAGRRAIHMVRLAGEFSLGAAAVRDGL